MKLGREIKTQVMKTTKAGDFVIARMQAVHGAMAATPPEFEGFHVSDSYATLVPRSTAMLRMQFFNYVTQTPKFYRLALLSAYGVTIEKMTFNIDWFLAEAVTIPSKLEEQQRISEVLQSVDQEIGLLQQELDALKKQKKGIMQKLLTGKVRVKL
jgi:type I restriction enzyme S subunit